MSELTRVVPGYFKVRADGVWIGDVRGGTGIGWSFTTTIGGHSVRRYASKGDAVEALEADARRWQPSLIAPQPIERACGVCRRYGHTDDACPENPETWAHPQPTDYGQGL